MFKRLYIDPLPLRWGAIFVLMAALWSLAGAAFAFDPQGIVVIRRAAGGCSGTDFTAFSTLEAHYPFDSEWPDSTANSNDLTESGVVSLETTTIVEGTGSADFSVGGGGDDLRIAETAMAAGHPVESTASTTGDMTYVVRARFITGDMGAFVKLIHPSDSFTDGMAVYKDASDFPACAVQFSAATWSSALSVDTWYSIACRWDSSDTAAELSLVVNGTEQANVNKDDHGVCEAADTLCMIFGANEFGSHNLQGFMDETLVFSEALSDAQLLDLHNDGAYGCGLP